ncbi:DNA end-binding protein Ku [Salana multivorans]|uniref:Non-homologous end joining protein Ku n=1 Tax=Salana multivorans TaxID=120377 RepID=A0A3N2DAY1_9MICO|nr:Ku protein [Salana multivorans]ROR96970.1 DNA end-binding protein Ku [Salana multivorans]
MRPLWSGDIAFGLVSVPVKLYSATSSHDVSFHQVHVEDGGRVRYERRCEVCGKVVSYEDIAKAYDDEGERVIVTEDDLATLPTAAKREIQVLSFVPGEQVDPILFETSYYAEPAGRSPKAYALLERVLGETGRVAVVSFALRGKARLGIMRVREGVLVVQAIHWADEVRALETDATAALADAPDVTAKELAMATALVESMAGDFDPAEYPDTYTDELRELIDAKLKGGEAFATEEKQEEEMGDVVDLVAALRRSVEERKKAGGSGSSGSTMGRAASKKPAASTGTASTAKSSTAKTSTRKTPAKKPKAS